SIIQGALRAVTVVVGGLGELHDSGVIPAEQERVDSYFAEREGSETISEEDFRPTPASPPTRPPRYLFEPAGCALSGLPGIGIGGSLDGESPTNIDVGVSPPGLVPFLPGDHAVRELLGGIQEGPTAGVCQDRPDASATRHGEEAELPLADLL